MADRATADDVFYETARTGPAWELALEQMAKPRSAEAPWEESVEGMAVRDVLVRLYFALDQSDVDAMMQFFTDDCVITNPRGTFSSPAAIRADLEGHIQKEDRRFHTCANVVVRMSDDFQGAAVTSYFLAAVQRAARSPHWVGGLSADELVKRNGEWRIRQRTTSIVFTAALVPPGE